MTIEQGLGEGKEDYGMGIISERCVHHGGLVSLYKGWEKEEKGLPAARLQAGLYIVDPQPAIMVLLIYSTNQKL